MNGVVVHAEHTYRGLPVATAVFIFIIAVLLLALMAWRVVRAFQKKDKDRWFFSGVAACVTAILFYVCVLATNDMFTIHTDKIVTIDDTVYFNEFYDNYEIISQDGNLYTVRELQTEEVDYEGAVG